MTYFLKFARCNVDFIGNLASKLVNIILSAASKNWKSQNQEKYDQKDKTGTRIIRVNIGQ